MRPRSAAHTCHMASMTGQLPHAVTPLQEDANWLLEVVSLSAHLMALETEASSCSNMFIKLLYCIRPWESVRLKHRGILIFKVTQGASRGS